MFYVRFNVMQFIPKKYLPEVFKGPFKNQFNYEPYLGWYKTGIIEMTSGNNILFCFELDLCPWGNDHAGMSLEVTLFGWSFKIGFYDSRHWDYENDCWMVYNENQEQV